MPSLKSLFKESSGKKIGVVDLIVVKIILEDFLSYSAQPVLYRIGEEVGRKYAEVSKKENLDSKEQLNYTMRILEELKGEKIDIKTEGNIIAVIKDGWESKAYEKTQPKPSCHYTRGLLAGIISTLFNKNGAVKETKCKSSGDDICEFVFMSR